jgi:hypothetical protein
MDILRRRYRQGFDKPVPLEPGEPLTYRFALPDASHVFLPGHRIMVQVQSSWFPLYDRNPQTFVPNIFDARPQDYRPATIKVFQVYGYATKTFSSRAIERGTYESVAFRFIAGNEHPDHDSIATFRKRFLPQIQASWLHQIGDGIPTSLLRGLESVRGEWNLVSLSWKYQANVHSPTWLMGSRTPLLLD